MSRPAFISIPEKFARGELDAPEPSIRFIAARESIQPALVKNRRAPMKLEHRAPPDFLHRTRIRLNTQNDGADFVIRPRDENKIVLNNRVDRVHRIIETRSEP